VKLGLCAQALFDRPFPEALALARELGFEALELPVHQGNPFLDLEASGTRREAIRQAVTDAGLVISALSNHQEGQLLLGPHGFDTEHVHTGNEEERVLHASLRLRETAGLAADLGVGVVCGFTGCEDYSRWFPWPREDGYERMAPRFRERLLPILDRFGELGVRFALECHPRQFAFNLETALWAVDLVDRHDALAFNFDPANLLLAGMDPVVFVAELGERIAHVHAKDGERVAHHVARSGLLAHGPWRRPDRGFRFRIPGWGEIEWRRILTELQIQGFRGVVALEHEDPTMSRIEGLRQGAAFLKPLLLQEPPPESQWW
jgi:sugar phosphate isomerase/epimerase